MASRFLKILSALFDPQESDNLAAYRRNILAEYKIKRPVYEEFGTAVHKLVDLFLKESGYKYQLMYRTKAPERLREKLIRKAGQGVMYERLGDVEDLVGLRVVFYSESDKDRFVKEIKKEIGEAIRIEEKGGKTGYKATHLIVAFGPKRLQLSEYKHFEGLKSEVQVTTMLRHSWAEIEHDLIYKDITGLREKDPQKFAVLEEKLEGIMEKYIRSASLEFEEVMKEIS